MPPDVVGRRLRLIVRLVVDDSVGLKWAIPEEEDSDLAEVLANSEETLLLPAASV